MDLKEDEVLFIREAFGAKACCNIDSWTLVFAFTQMVFSCCFLALVTFALLLVFTSSQTALISTWSFLTLLGVTNSLIFAILLAFFTSRIFGNVAELKGNFVPRVKHDLGFFCLIKLLKYLLIGLGFVMYHVNYDFDNLDLQHLQKFGDKTPDDPIGTLALVPVFISCDMGFSFLYILILALFISNRSRGVNRNTPSDVGSEVIVVKIRGKEKTSRKGYMNFNHKVDNGGNCDVDLDVDIKDHFSRV